MIIKNSVVHSSWFFLLSSCSGSVRGFRFCVHDSRFAIRGTVEPEHELSSEKQEV